MAQIVATPYTKDNPFILGEDTGGEAVLMVFTTGVRGMLADTVVWLRGSDLERLVSEGWLLLPEDAPPPLDDTETTATQPSAGLVTVTARYLGGPSVSVDVDSNASVADVLGLLIDQSSFVLAVPTVLGDGDLLWSAPPGDVAGDLAGIINLYLVDPSELDSGGDPDSDPDPKSPSTPMAEATPPPAKRAPAAKKAAAVKKAPAKKAAAAKKVPAKKATPTADDSAPEAAPEAAPEVEVEES